MSKNQSNRDEGKEFDQMFFEQEQSSVLARQKVIYLIS